MLYLIKNKSDASVIFHNSKALLKKIFNLPIIRLYSRYGGKKTGAGKAKVIVLGKSTLNEDGYGARVIPR